MRTHRLVEWQYLIILALLPLFIMGVMLLAGWVIGIVQYNPEFFTEKYIERYQTPNSLLEEVEQTIEQGNAMKVAELRGTYWSPRTLKSIPDFEFSIFWDKDKKYQDFLYFDNSNNQRYVIHIKVVNHRYVWAPENLYFYVDSGRWVRTFFPILAIWWIVLFLYIVTKRVYQALTNFKPEIVSDRIPK